MADLVAWRTDEMVPADVDRQPRRGLSVGMGRKRTAGENAGAPVLLDYCLFILEGQQAQDVLGLDLAQFSTEPVRVSLKLEVLGQA